MMARARQLYAELRWRSVAAIAALALITSGALIAARPTVMLVNGERVESDVSPITTVRARAFVPLRSIADALGAETAVDRKTGIITVALADKTLRLRVGDTRATMNGMGFTLKHAPFRVRGRVMISLDAVSRAFNVRTRYDARNARIEVVTPGIGESQ
ncbi:MAG: copper amine oxidase N-terminal domain-containing protein [Candidatus Eremiobacteraeota bacterium]|nr:copper amine oxidase N-terminal domain-containing protein [Candidatus Eremiobacteraeota bacterium]MBV9264366.1 copper amine oxidase N-terminal domain-containing protein [Candidatus Eremiobacteraeota bacterium]